MKVLSNLIRNIGKKEVIPSLGRWNIDNCTRKINKKIDLSNEDHCGPCGTYILEVKNSYNKVQNDNYISIYQIDK